MKNNHHNEILQLILQHSVRATQHTFLDGYLGNDHPRYAISAPLLRKIAKEWMRDHRNLTATQFADMIDCFIKAPSSTEKCMAGILLDNTTKDQRKFDPKLFDKWLDYLVGWAEIDSVCTGSYPVSEIPDRWKEWKTLTTKFSKSKNINKRRASLVLFCSPLRNVNDERLANHALTIVDRLKHEKEIIITRAISWVLRSMERLHRKKLEQYLIENLLTLPKVAVRETMVKLKTGLKSGARRSK